MKLICVVLTILLAVVLFVLFGSYPIKHDLSEEQKQILLIANEKVTALGYDPNEMSIIFDFDNANWRKHRNSQDPTFDTIDFQAIFYGQKERTLGGSLEIIVDKQKMEVIWFRRGQ